MPKSFTICLAYMTEAWTTGYASVTLFSMTQESGALWGFVNLNVEDGKTQFVVNLGNLYIIAYSERVLFPLTWTSVCLSLDTVAGNVSLVLDGEVIEEKFHEEALAERKRVPADLWMEMGYRTYDGLEFAGVISQLNIFSSPLSTARLVGLTEGGGLECGAPGDYVSWEEEDWKLTSQARIQMVDKLQGPCSKQSEVTVYNANFLHHSVATNKGKNSGCMEHCQKLGKGRSPPVRTLEEWDWLRKEVRVITPDLSKLPDWIWLAANDEEVEGEWRDPYPLHDHLNTTWKWPWMRQLSKDTQEGDTYNCLSVSTVDEVWLEWKCSMNDYACLKDLS